MNCSWIIQTCLFFTFVFNIFSIIESHISSSFKFVKYLFGPLCFTDINKEIFRKWFWNCFGFFCTSKSWIQSGNKCVFVWFSLNTITNITWNHFAFFWVDICFFIIQILSVSSSNAILGTFTDAFCFVFWKDPSL